MYKWDPALAGRAQRAPRALFEVALFHAFSPGGNSSPAHADARQLLGGRPLAAPNGPQHVELDAKILHRVRGVAVAWWR